MANQVKIAIDAMGGDNSPKKVLEGINHNFDIKNNVFYKIFGNADWSYYLLSQLFVITSFYIVFKFSEDFFNKNPDI